MTEDGAANDIESPALSATPSVGDMAGRGSLPGSTTTNDLVEADVLSERAAEYARASLSPATWRTYESHLQAWKAWCRERGRAHMPVSPVLVANHLAGTRSHTTLSGHLDAIARAHAFLQLPFSRVDPAIPQTMTGIACRHSTRPRRQAAATSGASV